MAKIAFLVFIMVTLATINGYEAVPYLFSVTNNVANSSTRFDTDIGLDYSLETLEEATEFIWDVFQETTPSERKNIQQVSLFIDDMDGVAYTMGDQIHVSDRYIESYTGDVKREITGVLYHESTHVWQWDGNGQAPGGLIEGYADYVRLKSGYVPSHWVNPGEGDRWDQGYDVTARFLDYCNKLRSGFVAELNKKMRDGYANSFFEDLLGKSVDQLWNDYNAKFSGMN